MVKSISDVDTAKEFLEIVLKRPGMYVGCERLDYIQIYLCGWLVGAKTYTSCYLDYDMQYWLFMKYSASIDAGTLVGWNLFYRCFGLEKYGIERFKEFIKECSFTKGDEGLREDRVAGQLGDINSYYMFDGQLPAVLNEEEIDKNIDFDNTTASLQELVRLVNYIAPNEYEKIYIFINHETCFLQVRIYYYVLGEGWIDGVTLAEQSDYYRKLLMIHGCVNQFRHNISEQGIITVKVMGKHIELEIEEVEEIRYPFRMGNPSMQLWEGSFEERLQKWQEKHLTRITDEGQ